MATSQNVKKLSTKLKVTSYDFDPDATTATDIAWVDMRDFTAIIFQIFRTIGTSDLTVLVLGNSEADGSGTDVTIKTLTITSQPDAVGDYIFTEIQAEEMSQAGEENDEDLRYVSLSVAAATGTDECVVTYIRGESLYNKNQLTADSVAT